MTPSDAAAVVPARESPPVQADYCPTTTQLEAIGRQLGEPGWLIDVRLKALEDFRRQPWPRPTDELWRRSDLVDLPLDGVELEALALGKRKKSPASLVKGITQTGGLLLVEDAAVRSQELGEEAGKAGVILAPLHQAAKDHPDLVRNRLGKVVPTSDGKYAALAAALADQTVFVHVPKGVQLAAPLHTLLWTSGAGLRAWRLLVSVEEDASLLLVHECASADGGEPATRLGIVELSVAAGARLEFVQVQGWGANVRQISHEKAVVGKGATLQITSANLGAQTAKTIAGMNLEGEGASGQWSGVSLLTGCQKSDYATWQNHLAPRTTSNLLFKTALLAESRSLWRGMVYISPEAQKADGYQANRNLLLSDKARAEATPNLEILADDVRCSHGVSMGELDPGELFYLLSRGIPEADAQHLLLEGFFEPILERISRKEIQNRVRFAIEAKMETIIL